MMTLEASLGKTTSLPLGQSLELHPDLTRAVIAGRYEVVRQLGAGGMSLVYQAVDLQDGTYIAIKMLHPRLAYDRRALSRFQREVQAWAGLVHPHIVRLLDSGQHEDYPFLVMEYVEGETLAERVDRESRLPEAEVRRIGQAVAEALAYAHAHGVIHRDVKLENVLLSDLPTPGRILLADFGTATVPGFPTITQRGMLIGTPHYLAPERIHGKPTNAGTDLYSLGVLLYWMATGHPPFQADDLLTILANHQQAPPVSPRQLVPELSPELDSLILRLLAKDPVDRFPSAKAVALALSQEGAYRGPEPEDTTAAMIPTWGNTRMRALLTLPLLLLLLGVGLALPGLIAVHGPEGSATPALPAVARNRATVTRTPSPTPTAQPTIAPTSFEYRESLRIDPTPAVQSAIAPTPVVPARNVSAPPSPGNSKPPPKPKGHGGGKKHGPKGK